jgi:hypothetical protein
MTQNHTLIDHSSPQNLTALRLIYHLVQARFGNRKHLKHLQAFLPSCGGGDSSVACALSKPPYT